MKSRLILLFLLLLLSLPSHANNEGYQVIAPENISDLQLINTFGRGEIRDLAWSPDGESIVVLVAHGFWVYEMTDIYSEKDYPEPSFFMPLFPEHFADYFYSAEFINSGRVLEIRDQ